jgi:hypothetical protein
MLASRISRSQRRRRRPRRETLWPSKIVLGIAGQLGRQRSGLFMVALDIKPVAGVSLHRRLQARLLPYRRR